MNRKVKKIAEPCCVKKVMVQNTDIIPYRTGKRNNFYGDKKFTPQCFYKQIVKL